MNQAEKAKFITHKGGARNMTESKKLDLLLQKIIGIECEEQSLRNDVDEHKQTAAEFIRCCNLFVLIYYCFFPLRNAIIDVIAPPIAAARASTQTSSATLSPVAGLLLLPSTA